MYKMGRRVDYTSGDWLTSSKGIVSYRFPLLFVLAAARCALWSNTFFALPTARVKGAWSWDRSPTLSLLLSPLAAKKGSPDGSDTFRFILLLLLLQLLVPTCTQSDSSDGLSSSTVVVVVVVFFWDTMIGSISLRIQAHSPPKVMMIASIICKNHHAPRVGNRCVCIHTPRMWKKCSVSTKSRTSLARWTIKTKRGMLKTAFTSQTIASVQPNTVSIRISASSRIKSSESSAPVSAKAISKSRLIVM